MEDFERLMNQVLLDKEDKSAVTELVRYFIINNLIDRAIDYDSIVYTALSEGNFKCLHSLVEIYLRYSSSFLKDLKEDGSEASTESIVFSSLGKLQIRKTIEDFVLSQASDGMKKYLDDKFLFFLEEKRKKEQKNG